MRFRCFVGVLYRRTRGAQSRPQSFSCVVVVDGKLGGGVKKKASVHRPLVTIWIIGVPYSKLMDDPAIFLRSTVRSNMFCLFFFYGFLRMYLALRYFIYLFQDLFILFFSSFFFFVRLFVYFFFPAVTVVFILFCLHSPLLLLSLFSCLVFFFYHYSPEQIVLISISASIICYLLSHHCVSPPPPPPTPLLYLGFLLSCLPAQTQVRHESRCRLLTELCLFSGALVFIGILAGLS